MADLSAKSSDSATKTDTSSDTEALDTSSDVSEEAVPEAVAEPEPKPIKIKGKGTHVSKKFKLTEGLAIFSMKHRGHSNFIVDLRSTDGEVDENLVNEIGNFKGSWPLFLSEGTYKLKVDADGPWSFTIKQPRPSDVSEVNKFEGKGKSATKLFYVTQGMKTVYLKHKGKSNFIVDIMGTVNENLVNEIGNYSGDTILDVSESGGAIMSIEADGPWSIRFEE